MGMGKEGGKRRGEEGKGEEKGKEREEKKGGGRSNLIPKQKFWQLLYQFRQMLSCALHIPGKCPLLQFMHKVDCTSLDNLSTQQTLHHYRDNQCF